MVWFGCTVTCDLIVTSGMVYYLIKSKTGFRRTDAMLTRLVRLIIETGFATTVIAVVDLALFAGVTGNNVHFITDLMVSKLYANNLLIVSLFPSRESECV
jgi:hypothetical protein